MFAEDLMSRPVGVVRADTLVREALALALDVDVEALPVVDLHGHFIGVFRDSARLRQSGDEFRTVAEVMTSPAISLGTDATAGELARVMLAHQLRVLPIVAGGKLVGVVDRDDLLRTLVNEDKDEVISTRVRAVLRGYAGLRRWGVHVVEGVVTVSGTFADRLDRTAVMALVNTVPGVVEIQLRREHPIVTGSAVI